jgi:hypothetical protein
MSSASHDEIVDLIGDVDELLVERLVATGASHDEISQAWGELEGDGGIAEYRALAPSPRVAEVRAILEELRDDLDDEYDEHPGGHTA